MAKKGRIVRHTAEELGAMTSETDWAKSGFVTEAELEASIVADPDEAGMVIDWDAATIAMPQPRHI